MNKKLSIFAFAALVGAMLLAAQPASAGTVTLSLKQGFNYAAIPATPADDRVPEVFADVMDKVLRLEWYDPATKLWRHFSPAGGQTNSLERLPAGTAFFATVSADCTVTVVAAAEPATAPAASFAAPLACGWNPVGVKSAISIRLFADGRHGKNIFDFVLGKDELYRYDATATTPGFVKVTDADYQLQPGVGYWINNDPDGDGVTSAKEMWDANGAPRNNATDPLVNDTTPAAYAAATGGDTSGSSSGDSSLTSQSDTSVLDLGPFKVQLSAVSYDSDGMAVIASGTVGQWPAELDGLLAVEKGNALPVEVLFHRGRVVSAYSRSPGNLTIAPALAGKVSVSGAKVSYFTITADGVLLAGCTIDSLKSGSQTVAEAKCVIKWFRPDPTANDYANLQIAAGPFAGKPWIQLIMPLSDETSVSRFWFKDNATAAVQEYAVDGKHWFLRPPAMAEGVLNLKKDNAATEDYSADLVKFWKWVPMSYAGDTSKVKFSTQARARFLGTMIPFASDAFHTAEGTAVEVDDDGRIKVSAGGNAYTYSNGALDIAPGDGAFHASFKGWKGVPKLTVGDSEADFSNSAMWQPSLTLSLAYEDDKLKISGGAELAVDVVLKLAAEGEDSSLVSVLTQFSGTIIDKIKGNQSQSQSGGQGNKWLDLLQGTTLHFNPAFLISYKSGDDEQRDFGLDFAADAKFALSFLKLEGQPRYGKDQRFHLGLQLDNIPYVGSCGVDVSRSTRWISDKFWGGSEAEFEELYTLSGGLTLDTALMFDTDWSLKIGANLTTVIQYTGTGTPPGGSAEMKKYKCTQMIMGQALASAQAKTLADSGWEAGLKQLRLEFDPADLFGNDLKGVMGSYAKNFKSSFATLRRVTGDATLKPPADLDWLPAVDAMVVWERLDAPDQPEKTFYRLSFVSDINVSVGIGKLDVQLSSLIVSYDSKAKATTVVCGAAFTFEGQHINAWLVLGKEGTKWKGFLTTGGIPLGGPVRIDNFLASFTFDTSKTGKDRFSDVIIGLGIRVQAQDLVDLGYPEGFYAGAMYVDGDIYVTLENIPLTLQQEMPDCGVQFEKFREIQFVHFKDGRNQVKFEVDALFSTFVDESKPREQWPRTTFSFFVGIAPQPPGEQRSIGSRLDFQVSCLGIGPIDCGDNAHLTLTEITLGRLAGGLWKLKGAVALDTPDGWRSGFVNDSIASVPKTINGSFEMIKGLAGKTSFKAAFAWAPPPTLHIGGDTQLACTEFVFTKASPWAFGVTSQLGMGGQTASGTIAAGGGGFVFMLPDEARLHLDMTGGFYLDINKLQIVLGKTYALSAAVGVTMPPGSPLTKLFGERITGSLSGSPDNFAVSADLNLRATLDFGQLGEGALGITSFALDSRGSFSANGSVTLANRTVNFSIGYTGGNFSFMADFGSDGISIALANIFALRIREKLGIATMFGLQYVQIDDMALGVGNKIAGVDLSTKKFIYFLPSGVPPVGFPFFDDFSGNVHVVGFEVNIGLQFPAPNADDAKILFDVISGGIRGKFDPAPLRNLHAPAFGIHDLYLGFPRIPGYTFKNGGFTTTDNLFADMFGSNKLTLVDRLVLGPAQIYDLATASSAFDVAKALIPEDKRHGAVDLNLRGFSAGASYYIKETDLGKYNPLVPKLPDLSRYVKQVRYVNRNTADFPAVLTINEGSRLLNAWNASDTGVVHEVGAAERDVSIEDKLRNFIFTLAASPEMRGRALNNQQYATAVISAVLNRAPKSASLPVYADNGRWLVNPFDSRCQSAYQPQSMQNQDEAAALAALLDKGISRGTAVNFVLAHDECRTVLLPALAAPGAGQALSAYVANAYQMLAGSVAPPEVQAAWLQSLQPSASWGAATAGVMAAAPAVSLDNGYYKAAFEISAGANTNDGEALVLELTDGTSALASQTYRAKDFEFAGLYQRLYLPFNLNARTENLALRIRTTGNVPLVIKNIYLYSAIQAQADQITLPTALGGKTATVRWDVIDISDETSRVQEFVQFLAPPENTTAEGYLDQLWAKMRQRGGIPQLNGSQATFSYSDHIQVQFEFHEYQDAYHITQMKVEDGQLKARFGSVRLFDVPNRQGEGWLLTADAASLRDMPVDDNLLASVDVSDGGKAIIFADANWQGSRTQVETPLDSLVDTEVGDRQASSVQVFFNLDMLDISRWSLTARTLNGTIISFDAGGVEVLFPGDPQNMRVLTMLPGSPMANAFNDMGGVIGQLKPQTIFDAPDQFLKETWQQKLLPLRGNVTASGCALEFAEPAGLSHKLEVLKAQNAPITGVAFDKDTSAILAKRGTVRLFPNSNFAGTATEVLRDISDLEATGFGRSPARSVQLADNAVAVFYPEANFGDFVQFNKWGGASFKSGETRLSVTQSAGEVLESGYYKLECRVARAAAAEPAAQVDAEGNQIIATYRPAELGLVLYDAAGDSPACRLLADAVSPFKAMLADTTVVKADLPAGGTGTVTIFFELAERATVAFSLEKLAADLSLSLQDSQLYRLQPGLNPESYTDSVSYLPERRRGSLRVLGPVDISEVQEWVYSRHFPGGTSVSVAHGAIKAESGGSAGQSTVAQGDTKITCALKGSANQILLKKQDGDGGGFYLEPRAPSGFVYPGTGYYMYSKITPDTIANINATAPFFRHFIRKTITIPDAADQPQVAAVNSRGGINATVLGTAITAVDPASKYSRLQLASAKGHQLRFDIAEGSDFTTAAIVSVQPEQTVPTFDDNSGEPAGIAIPIPESEKGGLFVNAHLKAGSSDVVQLNVQIAGAIKEDGNFFLKGNGDLVIAQYTVAEAEITLGSQEGLYIRGKMDLFGVAKAQVEGAIRPNGEFLLRGYAEVMTHGTGIKGSVTFDNSKFAVFGAIYICNYRIKSANFEISDGRIAYTEQYGIGFAGIDWTVWLLVKSPYGAGVDGRAYLDVDIPIKIWGVTSWRSIRIWLPFRKRSISIPSGWGWITIARIRTHFDTHVGLAVTGETVSIGIGPCRLGCNLRSRSLSCSW